VKPSPVHLLCVENVISHNRNGGGRQTLTFEISVANLDFAKRVEVHWEGEDGEWRMLPAAYVGPLGGDRELWRAQSVHEADGEDRPLPGDIRFIVGCWMGGREYWDGHEGRGYEITADTGIRVADGHQVLPVMKLPLLDAGQDVLPVAVAVRQALHPQRVFVRWSADRWKTAHDAPCYFKRRHWDRSHRSNARNPNKYGCAVWVGQVHAPGAYRIEYAIACEGTHRTLWANNEGENYAARHERLKVLTLNLHCNQEIDAERKLARIAHAIDELRADVVCLQEVCEPWDGVRSDPAGNPAQLLAARLPRKFEVHSAHSHVGFGRYLEGSAILSRFGFARRDAAYVSRGGDLNDIHARKVVMGTVDVPYMGQVDVFSTHLSWWSGGFRDQFSQLSRWADEVRRPDTAATLLCGDFNVAPGSEGYGLVIRDGGYEDQFKLAGGSSPRDAAPPLGNGEPTPATQRLDHVFLRAGSSLRAVAAREVFTDADYGRVSDHAGYLVEFEPL
jgi:maltose 6'-phosphate phosphatase